MIVVHLMHILRNIIIGLLEYYGVRLNMFVGLNLVDFVRSFSEKTKFFNCAKKRLQVYSDPMLDCIFALSIVYRLLESC